MYKIVSIPGDGIGPEVVAGAVAVLEQLSRKHGFEIVIEEHPFGGASWELHGEMLTQATLDACRNCDAVLLGAVGGPKWESLPHEHKPEAALLKIRKELQLFANLRPAKVYDALLDASSLKADVVRGTDFLVFRELTGGIYFGQPRGFDENRGWNTMVYERYEVERIARLAFETARKRKGKVVSIDKANVLEVSQLWRNVVHELHKEFADVELSDMYVDNAAMQIVRNPKQFDVIVTSNLFGDILSDLGPACTGTIGIAPSANLNPDRKFPSLFEPVHGSAPDIAGKGIANPIGQIWCGAMMLEFLGHKDAHDAVMAAIEKVLDPKSGAPKTPDIGGNASTSDLGRAIAEAL
jgi:3-isopropylmalate dehydrogenase